MAAKYRPPRRAAGILLRPRLVEALQNHLDLKLQLVIAPAGFGKTTLLVDLANDLATPAGWVTLDDGDRDPAAFIESLVTALRRWYPQFGARTLAALAGAPDVERRISAIARTFVAEVEEDLDAVTALILDDYHEVNDSRAVSSLLDELLRLLPDNLRIVLAGRSLPNLTVSRLLVEGQIFGLGEADLRFTADEMRVLLRRRHGIEVSPDQAAALAAGAEGWIAGFLLSVPRLWEGLVSGLFTASEDRAPLYEYLASEAFERQPAEVQEFLLVTSVPDVCDLDLCAALLGAGDWRTMLDRIEGEGLFLTRLGAGRGSFRYHQLFRGFLQTRLERADPERFARLHAITAEQMANRGEWQAAVAHYREAGREADAAALVARIAPELERTGRWRALARVVGTLPPAVAAVYPELLLSGAKAALLTQDLSRGETLAEAVRQAGAWTGDRRLEAWGYACLGNVRRPQGRTPEALDALTRALELAPDDEELAAAVRRDMGLCLGVRGDFPGAIAALRQALAYFDRTGAAYDAARTEFGLGVALAKSGQLPEAIARYESALARWRSLGDTGMEAEMLNCIGYAYVQRGEYARARATLEEGLAKARDGGYPRTIGATLHSLGEVLLTAGDLPAARATFEQGLATAQDTGELWMVGELHAGLALTHALEGDLARALELAHHAIALAQRQDATYQEATYRSVLGAIQARAGDPRAAVTLRDALAGMGGEPRRELVRAHGWLAQAEHAAGNLRDALDVLRQALDLADALGSDAALDLPARWEPRLFIDARVEGIAPARLEAVLVRTRVPVPVSASELPPVLPALTARGFGTGALIVDGTREVDWPWDKSRELFFLLAQHGARRAEQLMADLWPDAPPAKAKAALHSAVYRLRRSIGNRDVVITRGDVYRLNEEMLTDYDVREFGRLVQSVTGLQGEAAAALLERAVALSTAPFLDGIDTPWCVAERDRLDNWHLIALDRLVDLYMESGRFEECIAMAERLLLREPLREDVHARLIRAWLRIGDTAAALRQYTRCIKLLREELGITPGPEIQAFEPRLRHISG